MSKIGQVNLYLTSVAEELGIYSQPSEFTDEEKQAVKAELKSIIERNSCEADCPHRAALNLV